MKSTYLLVCLKTPEAKRFVEIRDLYLLVHPILAFLIIYYTLRNNFYLLWILIINCIDMINIINIHS